MDKLTFQQFLLRQPSFPKEQPTDKYYFALCQKLIDIAAASGLMEDYHPTVVNRTMLALIGYYQDVICDGGLWHAFIDCNRRWYGKPLPFYDIPDDYMDYELNLADVEFMVWYAASMYSENHRYRYPRAENLMNLARILFDELERVYEESPMPVGFCFGRELEMHDPDDHETIFALGNWLFMHSYLLSPAYALTLTEILSEPEVAKGDDMELIQKRIEQSMNEDPTGPLALFLGEWVSLIIKGKLPKLPENRAAKDPDEPQEHPYYTAVMATTGGSPIMFFRTYEELNDFFVNTIGWKKGEEHLLMMKGHHDFVILVNREKGMLLAKDVARCIAAPENPCYDKEFARNHAIDLLTVRALCPHDLLEYCLHHDYLPEAAFVDSDHDTRLVHDNSDFISRCYLQQYYRGD